MIDCLVLRCVILHCIVLYCIVLVWCFVVLSFVLLKGNRIRYLHSVELYCITENNGLND